MYVIHLNLFSTKSVSLIQKKMKIADQKISVINGGGVNIKTDRQRCSHHCLEFGALGWMIEHKFVDLLHVF